jgi:hypothetical protein
MTATALKSVCDSVCESVCDNVCESVCDSVVIFSMVAASVPSRRRTRHHGKRSTAQTVSLKPKECRAEPLVIEDPSAGWAGYLQ